MACAIVGVSDGSMWSFVHTPFWCGWRPVSIDIRDGTQIGDVQYAASNTVPAAARASRWGVSTTASP